MFGVRTLRLAYSLRPTERPDPADEPVPPRPPEEDDSQASAAAYGATVAHVINRPDVVRARAQVSATISAAVAAALAAFAPLTGVAQHAAWVKIPVALAVLSWLVSLWRYILVIAYSFHDYETETKDEPETVNAEPEDAKTYQIDPHLRQFLRYAAHMRARVERGTAATIIALAVTLVAALALAIEPVFANPEEPLRVSLNDEGVGAVDDVCDRTIVHPVVDAQGRLDDLEHNIVSLTLPEGFCAEDEVIVHLRRGWIRSARAD